MATLTLSQSFDGIWPPDALAGGTITLRQGIRMTYISEAGYTVTIRGTGLTYDDDGFPSGGTVTGFLIVKNGVTFANLVGASVDFTRAGLELFGYDEQNGGHRGPEPYSFLQNAYRGNDLMTGSAFNDEFNGTKGNDTVNAGAGSDGVGGEQGDDNMDGGADWDTLYYDSANGSWESFQGVNLDALSGIALDNWGNTDHFMNFEHFKDSYYSDTMRGANVDEEFGITRGNNLVDGRGGFDWADYSEADRWGAHRGVNVNLATGVAIDSWKGTDTLANIEGVRGTIFNDTITGSANDETFLGGKGVDVFNGGGGRDRLVFWSVGDNNDGGHGIVVNLGLVKEVVDDGYGNAENAENIEEIEGSRLNDSITGDNGMNWLHGNDGNDTIRGGGGEDDVGGDWGDDVVIAGLGNDHVNGGGGNDTLTGNAGDDQFNFNWALSDSGVDTITDFEVGIDHIWVNSAWGGGLTLDHLVATQFRSGAGVANANTAAQRVIYNSTTGDLYFDADGVGGVAAVKFAVLSNHAAITFDDFHVFL